MFGALSSNCQFQATQKQTPKYDTFGDGISSESRQSHRSIICYRGAGDDDLACLGQLRRLSGSDLDSASTLC